ncbi:MAG: bifunctional adenosylcobinamide kinase/adenosylcobinamide-phosphate guanylyltransferase, partial [Chloroflexota bacterium]
VTGGARSGKSRYAERLAASLSAEVMFVATAEPGDEDMRRRIAAHQASRPGHWQTLEAPLGVAVALRAQLGDSPPGGRLVLLDCITLLVSNLLLSGRPVEPEIEALIAWQRATGVPLIAVTNEVGLGIVPDNAAARRYRDLLGQANQRLAEVAGSVVLLVAGIALSIKGTHEDG